MERQQATKTNQTDQTSRLYDSGQSESPAPARLHPILQLQKTIGNRAVGRMIEAGLKEAAAGPTVQKQPEIREKKGC